MAVSNVAGSGQWITALDVTTEAEAMPRVKKQGIQQEKIEGKLIRSRQLNPLN